MDANSCTINRFKAQSNKFSGIISKGLPVVKQRLIKEMIYGIQASKDVKLSNISRALQENIPLIKTEDRLSRNLNDIDFTDTINEELLRLGAGKIDEGMVIAIDPGDIMKPYAQKMEKMCNIYDGSEGEKAKGYHLCQVTAANLEHNKIVPLYSECYSSLEENYQGSTQKIKDIITAVRKVIGAKGVWAIDRAGDCNEIIEHFENEGLKFVTRLKLNRWLIIKGSKHPGLQAQAERIEQYVPLRHKAHIAKIVDGKEEFVHLTFGAVKVAFPHQPDKEYTAVVIKGWGEQPMILLTAMDVSPDKSSDIWRIVEIYLTRWKCDECYRYIKQAYNLEDLRVRSYTSIRNISVLIHAIAYFTSIYLGISLKLKLMVQKIFILSKRLFGVPTFFNYAMADGIFELLKKTKTGIEIVLKGKNGMRSDQVQLDLFPD
jgi:hypothetical protein